MINTSKMRKPRKKRSMLWLYFTNLDNVKAKCGFCKSILSFKGGASANLRKHLISRHGDMLWRDPEFKFKQNYKTKYNIEAMEDTEESQVYNNYYKNFDGVLQPSNDNNEVNSYENMEHKPLEICSVSSYSIDEKIIELVKTKRELWDTTHASYNNTLIRQGLWNEVGKDADVNPKYAQRRWEALKSSYISDKNFKDPFDYTEKLSFLEDSSNAKNLPPLSIYSGSSLETDVDAKNYTEPQISNSHDAVTKNPTKAATTSAQCIGQLVTIKLEELPCDDARDEAELKIMNILYEIKSKYSSKLRNSH